LLGYFKGWYFKQQMDGETIALIPALHTDYKGNRTASLQVITREEALCVEYPAESFRMNKGGLRIAMGRSFFSCAGLKLDIDTGGVSAKGELVFGPLASLQYDIMGPFKFVPLMECRHSIISMAHTVNGRLSINGKHYLFEDALGYIEGDRGRSFPKRYAWAQCLWQEGSPCSLFLSVADIPFAGRSFTGIIAAAFINGREHRMATYLGAKADHIGDGLVVISQGEYTLSARRLDGGGMLLKAPVLGTMTRMIRENPACRARFRFTRGQEVLFDFETDRAGFEYEYDS
jgi:hypothetical protein